FKIICSIFLLDNLNERYAVRYSKYLSDCHKTSMIDSILRLPIIQFNQSQCLCW
ncbi:uncharacterized protein BX663DRAFT_419708, partial [Cokeromyces recurvatus]|uniref:uncharacterized protein n=1 Tax=Cokeromyces recurvatus TaxID=90255 RepID=UPI0022200390